jgi:hypothetical protein
MKFGFSLWVALALELALAGCGAGHRASVAVNPSISAQSFAPTITCRGCHDTIVAQHLESSHEISFTNPTFQAQYRKDLMPKTDGDVGLYEEARACIACHEPITYATKGPVTLSLEEVNPDMNGVTCDVCHTMRGFKGEKPMNGNYIIVPSDQKLGPFEGETHWHYAYSEFHSKSEICAVCHEAVNHHGFRIKETYTEWRMSDFAREGVECQDCHMNVDGFLTAGKPRFSSGKAAKMTLGSAPERARLYTHRFPGAHSKTQVEGALELTVKAAPADASQGRSVSIEITVDNSRTGHSMPSGSADLRLLWLEVTARTAGSFFVLPAQTTAFGAPTGPEDHAVAGSGSFDSELLGPEISRGSRVYRAIFADAKGQATLNSYDAVAKLFDNRLKAAEKRKEFYRLTIPEGTAGDVTVEATLKYLPYSSTLTDRLGLSKPEAVIVARRELTLNPGGL